VRQVRRIRNRKKELADNIERGAKDIKNCRQSEEVTGKGPYLPSTMKRALSAIREKRTWRREGMDPDQPDGIEATARDASGGL